MRIPVEDLLARIEELVVNTLFAICKDDPTSHREKVLNPKHTDPNNRAYKQDLLLQSCVDALMDGVKGDYRCEILVLGEEKGAYPDAKLMAAQKGYIAFVDAIDGTDLMARGFSNFCFSFLFFEPKGRKIILSVIAHSSGILYWADSDGAYRKNSKGAVWDSEDFQISKNYSPKLQDASVCFYGQKPRFLMNVFRRASLLGKISEFETRMIKGEELGIRIYNFAGNPMMVKIPEGSVDAIFELSGQEVHDVAPGAFIALKAGAVLLDLEGNEIDLGKALMEPRKKLRYILSATHSLAQELLPLLASPPQSPL